MAKKLYGTDPDQVPTNADLGTMAYQDSANVVIDGGSARIDAARPASSNTARAELELYASGNAPTYIINNSDRAAAGQHIAEFRGQWDGTAVARMVVAAGTDTTNKDDGVLSFWTASAGTMAKAAEFTSGGNLAFPNGQGIDFSASEGSGASSSVLDDYEEGTWTPATTTGTINTSGGIYTKIGRVVHCAFVFDTVSDTTSSAAVQITGLPFDADPNGYGWGSSMWKYNGSSKNIVYIDSSNRLVFYEGPNSGAYSGLVHSDLSSGAGAHVFLTYTTSE
jgi:hypothetical protein